MTQIEISALVQTGDDIDALKEHGGEERKASEHPVSQNDVADFEEWPKGLQ